MPSARLNKKKSANAAAKKKSAPAAPAADAKPKKTAKAAKAAPAAATPKAKTAAPKRPKPAADPRLAELKKQLAGITKQLDGGTLDLVTKVSLAKQKKELERRIADLTGDKPFLTKVPRHKQAA